MRGTRIRGLMQAMLRVGVIGFGGGNALIPVMEKEFVTKKPYVTKEEYDEAVWQQVLRPGHFLWRLPAVLAASMEELVCCLLPVWSHFRELWLPLHC